MRRSTVRVLIADGSALDRAMLRKVLASDPDLEVVGAVATGEEALRAAESMKPDVISLDPGPPGARSLKVIGEVISALAPTPVLVLSRGDTRARSEALEAGAKAVCEKPAADTPAAWDSVGEDLVLKVKLLSRFPDRPAESPAGNGTSLPAVPPLRVVLIGASTGGPGAVATVLGGLPADLGCALVIAVHTSEGFVERMVRWLDGVSPLEVRVARDGERVVAGRAYVAPGGGHTTLRSARLAVEAARDGSREPAPSVDRLLASAVPMRDRAMGVILTGMGQDGARGLASLRAAGARTLAESPETAVIYGMPRAALEYGAAERATPLYSVATEIQRWLDGPSARLR